MDALRRFLVRHLLPDMLLCERCGCLVRPSLHRCAVTEVRVTVKPAEIHRSSNVVDFSDAVELEAAADALMGEMARQLDKVGKSPYEGAYSSGQADKT